MTLWGRISAALRRTDPARLLGVGQAELARSARLEGSAAATVLDRAIAAFLAAERAGSRGEAAPVGLALALWARGDKADDPAAGRIFRARAVAHLKARLSARDARRDPLLRHRILTGLSRVWLPFSQDDPAAPAVLSLLKQAQAAQAAAVASLDGTGALGGADWAEALLVMAERDLALATHPSCPADVAADSLKDAGRALSHLCDAGTAGTTAAQRERANVLRARL